MNSHSFSTFANTISFNVSRYPTPVEITESKNYSEPEKHVGDREDAEKGVKDLDLTSNVPPTASGSSDVFVPGSTVCDSSNIEYVPAEYFRGVPTAHLVQSVVVSKSVTNVKPEVLASGRILTHMTPIPSTLTVTMSTTSDSILSTQTTENGHHHQLENGRGDSEKTK